MIKLIALDLDDTLLRSDLSVSFYTRHILKKTIARGIVVVLASGRTPSSLLPFAKKLGLAGKPGYFICENGALVLDSLTGEAFDETFIPTKIALTAYKLADAEGFCMQKYDGDLTYLSHRNEFTDYDEKLTGLKQVLVEDFTKIVEKGCRKLLIPGDPMILGPLEELLRVYIGDNATLFTSKPYFLEVLPLNTDKGTALAKICQKLNIDRNDVMAFGDSMNDLAMLNWSGVPVVMKNADERIKAAAKIITEKTNNDDGVARTIVKHVFGK
jgi:Cof subfamily protein (haloacid dehalogenase superfamily)